MGIDLLVELDLILRLALAALFGGIIGAQREIHGSPAGLRTHLLVSFGSALFTILSATAFIGLVGAGEGAATNYDPTRIAAQIVAGIGFLGAGAIIKDGATVRGLTTAASLWAVAAIGMAVGAGAVILASAATAMMLLSLGPLGRASARLSPRRAVGIRARLRVTGLDTLDAVVTRLSEIGTTVTNMTTTPLDDSHFQVEIDVQAETPVAAAQAMSVMISTDGVDAVETVVGTEMT